MRRYRIGLGLMLGTSALWGADADSVEAGKKLERNACLPCHSLRLIDSQRLSTAAWTKEIDKMVGWGAVVPERQKLIEYLAAEYSDTKPVPAPDKSLGEKSGTR